MILGNCWVLLEYTDEILATNRFTDPTRPEGRRSGLGAQANAIRVSISDRGGRDGYRAAAACVADRRSRPKLIPTETQPRFET